MPISKCDVETLAALNIAASVSTSAIYIPTANSAFGMTACTPLLMSTTCDTSKSTPIEASE